MASAVGGVVVTTAIAVGGLAALAAYLATRDASAKPAGQASGESPADAPPEWPTISIAAGAPRLIGRGLSRAHDELFRRHGRGLPVPYLRALAHAESGMRPDDPLGLINVVPVALADYNRRHPADVVRAEDLRRPEVSVRVAADILRTIIASYARHHPDVAALREDWDNPVFVALLTFGWNAGFSERAGVGRVVAHLRSFQPDTPITIDSVARAARAAGAADTLRNPRKVSYCKGVVATYLREVAAPS